MSDYVKGESMSLHRLRTEHPTWKWVSERSVHGFGWQYTGQKDNETVQIRAYSHLLNRYDGDEGHTVAWHVEDNTKSTPYSIWKIK